MKRRYLLGSVAAVAVLPRPGRAQAFPNRPVRFVVPYAPGGSTDTSARLAAARLSAILGQQVIVDNRPGGGTIIGTEIVAKSKPDGYTILLTPGALAVNAAFGIKLPYDVDKDLVPVMGFVDLPLLLAANNDAPFKTMAELVATSKTPSRPIAYASAGIGSIPHLWAEFLKVKTRIPLEHVGYKGSAEAMKDVLAGHVPLFSDVLMPTAAPVRAGHLRGLVVATAERVAMLPDVPTVGEVGLSGMESAVPFGVSAPAGTPVPIVVRLNTAFNEALADAPTRQKLIDLGFIPIGGTADAYGARIAHETARWRKVIQDSHIPTPG